MKLIIDIDKDIAQGIIDGEGEIPRNIVRSFQATIADSIKNGRPLEEIPNPCTECSQNCCVRELNGEKCECQKVYVVKESKK